MNFWSAGKCGADARIQGIFVRVFFFSPFLFLLFSYILWWCLQLFLYFVKKNKGKEN